MTLTFISTRLRKGKGKKNKEKRKGLPLVHGCQEVTIEMKKF